MDSVGGSGIMEGHGVNGCRQALTVAETAVVDPWQ